jgi:hypothetical protein
MAKPDLSEFFSKPKRTCVAGRLILTLSEEEQEQVLAAMAESTIDTASIVRFINRRGVDVKHPAMLRHRKKECACGK